LRWQHLKLGKPRLEQGRIGSAWRRAPSNPRPDFVGIEEAEWVATARVWWQHRTLDE